MIQSDMALGLISAAQYDEAAVYCSKLPASDSFKGPCLARVRLGQGRFDEVVEILTGNETVSRNPQNRGFLGYAYAPSGRREDAERMAAASHFANEQALIFASLGEKDRTLAALTENISQENRLTGLICPQRFA